VGAPRRTWMDDIIEWSGVGDYAMIKIIVEERKSWRLTVVNFLYEDKIK